MEMKKEQAKRYVIIGGVAGGATAAGGIAMASGERAAPMKAALDEEDAGRHSGG